jgi:hypothetical protein
MSKNTTFIDKLWKITEDLLTPSWNFALMKSEKLTLAKLSYFLSLVYGKVPKVFIFPPLFPFFTRS